ncbi:hypothetical protein BH23ACI1_BH23ACI1_24750 [soil metagenome]
MPPPRQCTRACVSRLFVVWGVAARDALNLNGT